MSVIGFIGLGRMGAGMAARLLAAGESLVVHDLSETAVATLVGQGAEEAESPKAVGSLADIVFTSLPSPAVFSQVMLGEGGREYGDFAMRGS